MKKNGWGFDVRDIDEEVRPQDDFYRYANGNWLKRNPIPKAEAALGFFHHLALQDGKKIETTLRRQFGTNDSRFLSFGNELERTNSAWPCAD